MNIKENLTSTAAYSQTRYMYKISFLSLNNHESFKQQHVWTSIKNFTPFIL